MELGGEELLLQPFGFMRRYRYQLVHPFGRIGISPKDKIPPVYVQPNAEALHGMGPRGCMDWFSAITDELAPGGRRKASRVDVMIDVQGWHPTVGMRDRFVTRATHLRVYEDHGRLTALQFGKRGGAIFARIYCKSAEVEQKGSTWWHDLWGERWIPTAPVWRIEFEVRRKRSRSSTLTPSTTSSTTSAACGATPVVSIDGVVASLAITEFVALITGLRPPMRHLVYRGEYGVVRRTEDEPNADCYYCQTLWGPAQAGTQGVAIPR